MAQGRTLMLAWANVFMLRVFTKAGHTPAEFGGTHAVAMFFDVVIALAFAFWFGN